MHRPLPTAYLGILLTLALSACRPVEQPPSPAAEQPQARASSYLFMGNPGIRTSVTEDVSSTLTGTVDGNAVAFGPDQALPVISRTGYDPWGPNAVVLNVSARNDQYSIALAFNGPFEAGRTYQIYAPTDANQDRKFDPYLVTPSVRIPQGQFGKDILDIDNPGNRVRITAITPDYMDIEFLFTLNKAGARQEMITMRLRNRLNENRDLRARSEGEPYWDYRNVTRMVEGWDYIPRQPGSPGVFPTSPSTTRVLIGQSMIGAGTSVNYAGKTEQAAGQTISLYQKKQASNPVYIEYSFATKWSATGTRQVDIIWPDFKGVGVYTGDQVSLSFTNYLGNGDYWMVRPTRSAGSAWEVNVQRVTPDLIEGAYTIIDAPIYQSKGSTLPTSASVSGRFSVIYPR